MFQAMLFRSMCVLAVLSCCSLADAEPSASQKDHRGTYTRYLDGKPDPDSAEITVGAAPGGRLSVDGKAVKVFDIRGDIPDGEAKGLASFRGTWGFVGGNGCAFSLRFDGGKLVVSGDHESCGGHGVSFNGVYLKARSGRRG